MNAYSRFLPPMRPALLAAVCAVFFAGSVQAQMTKQQIDEERTSIAAERAQAKDKFTRRDEACRRVFLTTKCVNEANADWRRARNQLNEREAAVDQIERQQRAAERLDQIEKKQSDEQVRARAAAAEARRQAGVAKSDREKVNAESAASAASAASATAAATAERQRKAASKCGSGRALTLAGCASTGRSAEEQAAYEKKEAAAKEHKQSVLERNAARDPKKVGKPLPVPDTIPPSPSPSPVSQPAR